MSGHNLPRGPRLSNGQKSYSPPTTTEKCVRSNRDRAADIPPKPEPIHQHPTRPNATPPTAWRTVTLPFPGSGIRLLPQNSLGLFVTQMAV
jgi:hypothetical protein